MVFILAQLKSVDTKHSEQSKTRTRHVMVNMCLLVKTHPFWFIHLPGLYRKADKSIPSFGVVLVLSVARGFLCLTPVGFYSKQMNVKPCSKCLHQMFNNFHPF